MAKKKAPPSANLDSREAANMRSPDVCYREMTIVVDAERAAEADDTRIPIAFSSEAPVERYDWWEDERFLEVLDHSPEAVDLSYARDGLPFLVGHTSSDMTGLVEDVVIGKDGKGRGMLRSSRSQRGQEIAQDIRDGIRKKVSVGYTYDRTAITREQKSPKDLPTITLHRWKPLEVSSVPIPADYDVGVGRSAELVAARSLHLSSKRNAAPQAEEHAMAENANAAPAENGAARIEVREQDTRMKNVAELAAMLKMEGVFAKGVSEGKDADAITADIRAEHNKRVAAGEEAIRNGGGNGVVQLTEKEQKQYSLARAIMAAAGEEAANFEMEVSKEIGKKLGRDNPKGFWFPTNTRTYVSGSRAGLYNAATVGAETVFDVPGSFIEQLRKRMRVAQAGATVMSGLHGPVTFPKQVAAGTAYWMPENGGTNVTASNLVLGTVTLTPKTVQSTSSFSKQLLAQTSIDTENLIRNDLAAIHALAWDLAALNGAGSGSEPLGIIPDTNCNTVALGTHGAAPDYISIVKMEEQVELDDADNSNGAYITTPSVKRKLKTTQDFPTSNGSAIWNGGIVGEVNGYPAYSTNQVPSNLTKGTSTTVCHGIVFGHFANLLLGEWGAMEIIVDPYSLKKQGMIEITSFQMGDIAKKYAQAFCVVSDALPG
jgi:HK97 family phage major capsid protein